jgi:hypothetical protein
MLAKIAKIAKFTDAAAMPIVADTPGGGAFACASSMAFHHRGYFSVQGCHVCLKCELVPTTACSNKVLGALLLAFLSARLAC